MSLVEVVYPTISVVISLLSILVLYVRKITKMEDKIDEIVKKVNDLCKKTDERKEEINGVKTEVAEMKVKTNLFWNIIEKNAIDFLHHPNTVERDNLLEKLKDKTITLAEMEKLKIILEDIIKERKPKDELFWATLLIGRLEQLIFDCSKLKEIGEITYGRCIQNN